MSEIQFLGEFTDTVWLFSGPYSNLQATQALQQRAQAQGVSPERIICLGDIVAYYAQPEETTQAIRDWGIHCMQGNCEQSLATNAEHCGCGFGEDSTCSLYSSRWYSFAQSRVSEQSKAWMGSLPMGFEFIMGNKRVRCVHGSVNSINEFMYESTPTEHKQAQIKALGVDIVIAGHTGIPFGQVCAGGTAWLNTGALGMPANDGTPDTWFFSLTPEKDGVGARWHRLAYDVRSAEQAVHASVDAGALPNPYLGALSTGVWPSDDSLPDYERSVTANAIKLDAVMI